MSLTTDNTLTGDISLLERTEDETTTQVDQPAQAEINPYPQHSKPPQYPAAKLIIKETLTNNEPPQVMSHLFTDSMSPIRPLAQHKIPEFLGQDESVISLPSFSYVEPSNDRRSSTPSRADLDTSTLDRIDRISQMMAETKNLFS